MPETNEQRPNKFRIWLSELRLPFTTVSIVPILLGTAIAWGLTGIFLLDIFLLTLIGGVFIHLGANVANDYWDYQQGSDNINVDYIRPFTGGSRIIQRELLSPRAVLAGSIVLLGIGAIIGLYLTFTRGLLVLILGGLGIFLAFFYSAPPIKFVSRGIGEIVIGICFGVFLTFGAFYTQTQIFAWEPIILSLPIALLVSAILYINEFADFRADRDSGKHTLVVRLGRQGAAKLYVAILILVYLIIVLAVFFRITTWYSLLIFSTLPLSILGARYTLKFYEQPMAMIPANISTIVNHLLTGITLTLAHIFLLLSVLYTHDLVQFIVIVVGILSFLFAAFFARRVHKQTQALMQAS
ncbi:MAG: 1,4-dihydroxy-2-naphthoate octaprenyltransferase [Candidatus Hodarchaeota archaeon]